VSVGRAKKVELVVHSASTASRLASSDIILDEGVGIVVVVEEDSASASAVETEVVRAVEICSSDGSGMLLNNLPTLAKILTKESAMDKTGSSTTPRWGKVGGVGAGAGAGDSFSTKCMSDDDDDDDDDGDG
jgi:hypothetical protein